MNQSKLILKNTIALYLKIIINTVIALFLTRIILNKLGVNDFGIFNLISGTIAFLSFINSALLTSSQRFFSFFKGKNDVFKLRQYFETSLLVHIYLSLIILVIFEIAYFFLFDFIFNISQDNILSAKIVYQLTAISMIVTIIGVPYNSAINANEDLVFFSIIEIMSSILKLGIIFLFKIPLNPLILYTIWITLINVLGIYIRFIWCTKKYEECKKIKLKINKNYFKELLGFSGWNSLGAFAQVSRSQGVAIVINFFWGTAINAVYGIANQINGQLSYFSQMLTASFAPQIIRSAGEGNNKKMIELSVFCSKSAFFMSAIFAIPLLINLEYILKLWLKEVPQYTSQFSSLIVYVFLIMQLYPGLDRAIQATGKIKSYQICISILFILPVIIGIIIYYKGFVSYAICYIMIIVQFLVMITTIVYSNLLFGLNILEFLKFVFKAIFIYSIIYLIIFLFDEFLLKSLHPFIELIINTSLSIFLFTFIYLYSIYNRIERYKIFKLLKLKNDY